ncbi:MAG TPA: formate/nitrite transporter family protein [Anaerolineaceae bacterium]
MSLESGFDSLTPPEVALKTQGIGVKKAGNSTISLISLSLLAGIFIALGAVFATIVFSESLIIQSPGGNGIYSTALPYGLTRLLGGLVFCTGLAMVLVGGGELFTGNMLMVIAWMQHQITFRSLLRNWVIVYAGNFLGSILIAGLVFLGNTHMNGGGAFGLTALNIAKTKAGLDFFSAFFSGVLCNLLVCMAVWMSYSARTTGGKIAAILLPISAFVAAGFEHSVANMYFLPMGLLIKDFAPLSFWSLIGKTTLDFSSLTWEAFFIHNLLPVTLGNIFGGAILVGWMYWVAYLRKAIGK